MTKSTLLAGLLIVLLTQPLISFASLATKPRPTNYILLCRPDVYGYGEHMLVRIIAYNSKKNDKRQVNKNLGNLKCNIGIA